MVEERNVKDAHLSLETLAKWLAGDLDPEELHTQIVPHLLAGCPVCSGRYDEIQRLKHDLGHWDERVVVFEGQEASELVAELAALPFDRQLDRVAEDSHFQTWAVCQILLRQSLEVAREEPVRAMHLAELAALIAGQLGPAYDPGWVLDLRARAEACQGNARRALGELHSAETAFRRAEALLAESSTGNPEVRCEILGLKAALLQDQERPEEALRLLEEAAALRE